MRDVHANAGAGAVTLAISAKNASMNGLYTTLHSDAKQI